MDLIYIFICKKDIYITDISRLLNCSSTYAVCTHVRTTNQYTCIVAFSLPSESWYSSMVILSVFRVRFPPVLGSETFFWICDKASVANSLLLNYQAASQFNMMNNIVRPTLYSRIVTTMFKQQPCKYLCVLAAIIWVTERYLCARINPTSNIPPPPISPHDPYLSK